jgi:site-specific recombinase XerD
LRPSPTPVLPSSRVLDDMGEFDLLARWVEWLEARDLSEATVGLYCYGVFRLFRFLRFPSPSGVTEHDINAFLRSLGHRAPSKVIYYRGIRSAFRYWHRKGWIPNDPTVDLYLRKPRRPPRVALEESELIRYLVAAAARDPRRAWTLMLVFGLGTRRMEAAAIRPEDVGENEVRLTTCKYSKQRTVELSRYARVALEELKPWWNGTVLGGISKQTITAWAHEAAADSGLLPKVQGRVAHVLRASFASHLLANGVAIHVVRDLLGHESLNTTNDYAACLEGQKAEGVRRLDFRP